MRLSSKSNKSNQLSLNYQSLRGRGRHSNMYALESELLTNQIVLFTLRVGVQNCCTALALKVMIQNGPLKVISRPDCFSGGNEESSLETRLHTLKVGAQSYSFEN